MDPQPATDQPQAIDATAETPADSKPAETTASTSDAQIPPAKPTTAKKTPTKPYTKRHHRDKSDTHQPFLKKPAHSKAASTTSAENDPHNPFLSMFQSFRDELDQNQDRRERVIKTSRDVTALSKKVIFSLQRARKLNAPLPKGIQTEVDNRLKEIFGHLNTIAPDLQALDTHRWARNISGGLQELMEALLFKHYLETRKLLTYDESCAVLPAGIHLPISDYILGVYDYTGEVMRFGITMVALRGDEGEQILEDLRTIREALEGLEMGRNWDREADKKNDVMRQSLRKVEEAVYGMVVRGSEKPPGWVPEQAEAAPVER